MVSSKSRPIRRLVTGLAFLSPNILGFLAFVAVPLVMSLVLAFSNWDLRLHNLFKDEPIRFVGLTNFIRLFRQPDFLRFLGNTLYFMLAVPFTIAGSLVLALVLSKDLKSGVRPTWAVLIAGVLLGGSCVGMACLGNGDSALALLLTVAGAGILMGGLAFGSALYRTLFFLPSFTAGVAVYILWKKLYNPNSGPINAMLAGPLRYVSDVVTDMPSWPMHSALWVSITLAIGLFALSLRRLRRMWSEGDLGGPAALVPVGFLVVSVALGANWVPDLAAGWMLVSGALMAGIWQAAAIRNGREFYCRSGEGFGSAVFFSIGSMVLQLLVIGAGVTLYRLPAMVRQAGPAGLQPPNWLTSYEWAKPALMIMMFWLGVGSRNMLLYLAGLSNVPQDLYEAADIDGASQLQRFWHVTWPQLAPTTFFIVVMSVISGLQGGFDMVRTMTEGGPAGATTTLSYFIYAEGFETGRLGYSSAVAWTMFALILALTLINWKFGNRYVND